MVDAVKHYEMRKFVEQLALQNIQTVDFIDRFYIAHSINSLLAYDFKGQRPLLVREVQRAIYSSGEDGKFHEYLTLNSERNFEFKDEFSAKPNIFWVTVSNIHPHETSNIDKEILKEIKKAEKIRKGEEK